MKEFLQAIFGNASIPQFAASMVFAYLTAFAMLMYRTTKRDVNSANTPVQFSWGFLWSDNRFRIIANVILIFLAVRFNQAWIGPEWTTYAAVVIGLISDKLGWLLEMLSDKLSAIGKSKIEKLN
jgi:hypothetical protein